MSAGPLYWDGYVHLEPGVTARQVLNLYLEHCAEDEDQPELPFEIPQAWDDDNQEGYVGFIFDAGGFGYTADGELGWSFCDAFDAFLNEVAEKFADRGWLSTEGEDKDPVWRGATLEMQEAAALTELFKDLTSAVQFYNDRARKWGAHEMIALPLYALATYQRK